jgi:hypothetical protein
MQKPMPFVGSSSETPDRARRIEEQFGSELAVLAAGFAAPSV